MHDKYNHIIRDETVWGKNFNSLIKPMLEKYGLASSARISNPGTYAEADGSVTKLFNSIINMLGNTALKIGGQPVLAQFSVDGITPEAVEVWKKAYAASNGGVEPFFMTTQTYNHLKTSGWPAVANGQFGWIELDEGTKSIINEKIQMISDYLTEMPTVTITHFEPDIKKDGGAYLNTTGTVKMIDDFKREIILTDGTIISIERISDIEGELFKGLE